jgi:thioredoxin-dependent peroxiredoxin
MTDRSALPDFELPATGNQRFSLSAFKGHPFGVSRDSVKSHENFKQKLGFPFELLSDPDEKACAIFGVMKMKNMYGRQVRGIEQTFPHHPSSN